MRPIMGIDPSLSSTGYSGCGLTGTLTSKESGVIRLDDLAQKLASLVVTCPPNVGVVIEGYSFASKNSQAHSIGELGGVYRLTLYRMGIPFVDAPPTTRAKFATGRGNASKSEVISALSARTGIVWSGKGADDMADAYILEEMGLTALGRPRHSWPQANLEALTKIDWSPLLNGVANEPN